MTLPLLNPEGVTVGRARLGDEIAQTPIKQHLIHEAVVNELARRRAGTHSTRNRSEVRGGGAKPWRQKGTGRARQGSRRAPQWTGGAVVFGPTPRSYGGKVNRKVRRQAFRAALRAHAERGSLALMDATGWEVPSTRRAAAYLYQAPEGLEQRPLLLVVDDVHSVEALSFRNLDGVYVLQAGELEIADIVAARALLVERGVWERIDGAAAEVEAVEPRPKAPPAPKQRPEGTPKTVAPPPEAAEPEAEEEPAEELADEPTAAADAPVAEGPEAAQSEPEVEAETAVEEPEAEADEQEPDEEPPISDEELEAEAMAAASEPEGVDFDDDEDERERR